MSVVYVETYKINGVEFGIEDHKDGAPADDHFFHDHFLKGRTKRFHCWRGGCGIGESHSLNEARLIIRDYALKRETEKRDVALDEARNCSAVVDTLGSGDIFHLAKFLV
jgi:hypothetical protein